MSIDQDEVPSDRHHAWFAQRLADAASEIWIGKVDGAPVGVVRFDLVNAGVALISIIVAPEARGRGHGSELLTGAMARQGLEAQAFRATVRRENHASRRLFESAGFHVVESDHAVVILERLRLGRA